MKITNILNYCFKIFKTKLIFFLKYTENEAENENTRHAALPPLLHKQKMRLRMKNPHRTGYKESRPTLSYCHP